MDQGDALGAAVVSGGISGEKAALHSAGRGEEAITVLKDGLARHPEDRDILLALITFNRDAGKLSTALDYAERLARIAPNDREVANLVQSLRDQTKGPNAQ